MSDQPTDQPTQPRPWAGLADEERDGHWADYEAWRKWFGRQKVACSSADSGAILDALDEMEGREAIHLYCLMCDLADSGSQPRPPDTAAPPPTQTIERDADTIPAMPPGFDMDAYQREISRAIDDPRWRFPVYLGAGESVGLLAMLQLALRHPSVKDTFAAMVAETVARGIHGALAKLGPNVRMVCEEGWRGTHT